ncbi:helix-turn-helix transcriptional regulator [Streptomonospora arabica]|uniref:HTH cro/C1-type domain-containing protein n=1 Tax=Streptomonospora arabica TaxID=412417 RepID=A0ABV9SSF3_9ACTN
MNPDTLRHRRRAQLVAAGQWNPWGDLDQVRTHIRHLRDTGVSMKRIAARAGVGVSTLSYIMGPARLVQRGTADRILAVAPDDRLKAAIDATGARRRVQALQALGYSGADLARAAGISRRTVTALSSPAGADAVLPSTAGRIARAYDELCMRPAADSKSARTMRTWAAKQGWLPPLAWDDDSIDDPGAVPDLGEAVPRFVAIGEDAAELEALGYPRDAIAERLGVTRGYVVQALTAHRRRTTAHEKAA